jgi:hypothetical protein
MKLEHLADRLGDSDVRDLLTLAVGPRTKVDGLLARYANDQTWNLYGFTSRGSVVAIIGLEARLAPMADEASSGTLLSHLECGEGVSGPRLSRLFTAICSSPF